MPLSELTERLYNLRRDRSSGYEKPYKPALLLSLIDLVERGDFEENRALLTDELIARYGEYLRIVGGPKDQARIEYPFWHLCGDAVWMIFDPAGNPLYRSGEAGSRSPSVKWLRENMGFAAFDEELFHHLNNPVDREFLRNAITSRYFPQQREFLRTLVAKFFSGDRQAVEDKAAYEANPVRNGAFAKTIKEVYDFRCAACGTRFRFQELTLVDACHLIPFSESFNDHPSNGIALCKNHHWALDRHLIAPAPGETRLLWKPSPLLDDRIEGQEELLRLAGKHLLLPRERKFHPNEEAVRWRTERLLGA